MPEPMAEALAAGALPNIDALLQVRRSVDDDTGMRAIDIVPSGGITTRILPDRGLDLGQCWFAGMPLAWVSAVGESAPLAELTGDRWSDAFGGGLVVTCGLRNVGAASEGHGLHGTFSHLRADDVAIEVDQDAGIVTVSGRIVDDLESPPIEVARTITVWAGEGRVRIDDVAVNKGGDATEAPLLYHCNFGHPLWSGPAFVELAPVDTVARDRASEAALGAWSTPPAVAEGPEWVLEHTLRSEAAWATVTNSDLGVVVTLRWDAAALPRCNQWIDANPGMAVLGIEPANSTTRGRGYERSRGILPMLEPGEPRHTRLTIEASHT